MNKDSIIGPIEEIPADIICKKLKVLENIKKEISDCLEFYYDEEHDYGEVWCCSIAIEYAL